MWYWANPQIDQQGAKLTDDVLFAVSFLCEDGLSKGKWSKPKLKLHLEYTKKQSKVRLLREGFTFGYLLGIDEDDEHEEVYEESISLLEVGIPQCLGNIRDAVAGKQTAQLEWT